jgi:hypothetical protein
LAGGRWSGMVSPPERQLPAQALGRERLAHRPAAIVEQATQPRLALILTRRPDPPANNRLGVVGRAAHRAGSSGSSGSAGRSSGSSRGTGSSSGSIVYSRCGLPISTLRLPQPNGSSRRIADRRRHRPPRASTRARERCRAPELGPEGTSRLFYGYEGLWQAIAACSRWQLTPPRLVGPRAQNNFQA